MNGDPLNNPLNELGHISLHVQRLSESMAKLAAGADQVSGSLRHGTAVFTPILSELTGEMKRLRLEIHEGSTASNRSAKALFGATVALVLATLVMAWPIWFPPVAHQPAPAVSAPPAKAP